MKFLIRSKGLILDNVKKIQVKVCRRGFIKPYWIVRVRLDNSYKMDVFVSNDCKKEAQKVADGLLDEFNKGNHFNY